MTTPLFDRMVALAGCVESELDAIGVSNCRLIVTAADAVDLSASMESGDTAWVALGRTEPVLLLEEGQSTKCASVWRHTLTIGHVTCYPIQEDPLSDQQMLEITQKQLDVHKALRRAMACCSWAGRDPFDVVDWVPIFEGGVVGGQWQMTLDG